MRGTPVLVQLPHRQAGELQVGREPASDLAQEAVWIPAVVVGNPDQLRGRILQAEVDGPAHAAGLDPEVEDLELASALLDELSDSAVRGLVDDDHPERRIMLRHQRIEQALQFAQVADRRHDERRPATPASRSMLRALLRPRYRERWMGSTPGHSIGTLLAHISESGSNGRAAAP